MSGLTHYKLPHLSGVPHLHVNRPLRPYRFAACVPVHFLFTATNIFHFRIPDLNYYVPFVVKQSVTISCDDMY